MSISEKLVWFLFSLKICLSNSPLDSLTSKEKVLLVPSVISFF